MKEIESLRIKNFQTHKDTLVHFVKGLNVFLGDSRNGKTAILRILRWIYYDEPRGDRFIRIGEDQCEGEVILVDGTSVQRIRNRSGKVNCYVLNEPGKEEQVFAKYGKEVPLEIQRALGVSKLVLDKDTSIELNFSRQMDAAFLVNDSAPRRAKIIGRVVNLHVIDSASRTAENDLKAAKREKVRLEEDTKALETKIAVFDDLPDQEAALEKAKALMVQINALAAKTEKLQEIETAVERVQLAIAENNIILDRLKDIGQVKALAQELSFKVKLLISLEELQKKITSNLCCLDIQTNIIIKLAKLEETEGIFKEVARKAGRLDNLQSIDQSINATLCNLQSQRAILVALKPLEIAGTNCSDIKKKYNTAIILSELKTKILDNEVKVRAYQNLLAKTQNLERGQEIIAMLSVLRDRGYKLSEVDIQIKKTQMQLKTVTNRINTLVGLEQAQKSFTQLQNEINRLKALFELDKRVENQVGMHEAALKNAADMEQKYLILRDEYTDVLEQSDRCPICHTSMTPEIITQLMSVHDGGIANVRS